ncbi:stromal 70 kDa heat shock-related protein, chloroplastic-like protein, partial [Tanacetum coccineum]
IVDRLAESFKKHAGLDLLKDKHGLQCLTESARKANIELSTFTETNIILPFISVNSDGPKHIHNYANQGDVLGVMHGLFERHSQTPLKKGECGSGN